MMKRVLLIPLLAVLTLATACVREPFPAQDTVPEGTPVFLNIGFGATTPVEVQVGTKAEASEADESRVHDLYVLVFDSSGKRLYNRYFNYEHKWENINPLTSTSNESEGWYVENKTMEGIKPPVTQTRGAVKIATTAQDHCTLVLLANVSNALVSLGGEDPLDALNAVTTYTALKDLPVRLEQNVVERKDLFLMAGVKSDFNMTDMKWSSDPNPDEMDDADPAYRVTLAPLDAKVKFRIKANTANIEEIVSHQWTVCNVPSSCYLFPREPYAVPDGNYYFDTEPLYFDADEGDYKVFTFYMLESRLTPAASIPDPGLAASYYLREKREAGGAWTYAPEKAPYVTFNVSVTFKDAGIDGLDDKAGAGSQWDPTDNPKPVGVTGELSYTVHLGDFSHTGAINTPNANDYTVRGGYFYTYDITLNNAASLYAEVKYYKDQGLVQEPQPGQEGSLLLYSDGMVNCDAHYEYRMIEFKYSAGLAQQLALHPDYHVFSWSVKTPFTKAEDGVPSWDDVNYRYVADKTQVDFLWVKFAVNKLESGTDPKQSTYSKNRMAYPGQNAYDETWYPGKPGLEPGLMDINQLVNFFYYQYRLKNAHDLDPSAPVDIFDTEGKIRVTAFVDEYYYESDPFTGMVNPDLWRQFVNAEPREMHILSDVQTSQDQQSNLVNASHSIIQLSIQTIFNVSSPDLSSIWGLEHKDEMRETDGWGGWAWLPSDHNVIVDNAKSPSNGRLNSAAEWELYPAPDDDHDEWTDFLNYAVINSVPELKDADHQKMAYSCLTRNRDNNGNGKIDLEEIRWYTASIDQLKGMWIGNESLSASARVYQPVPGSGDWRSHVISSTAHGKTDDKQGWHPYEPWVFNAEETSSTIEYFESKIPDWLQPDTPDAAAERRRESVRCVRNVGTYLVGNTPMDISSAPLTVVPDEFYSVEEHKDPDHPSDSDYNTYTISFRNLDPRSLREYTDTDLPFHDEKSANNRVYLDLHVQSRASRSETPGYRDLVYGDGEIFPAETGKIDGGTINEDITNAGFNRYCPEGYRLPNQKELLMMAAALAENGSYWNPQGNLSRFFPSRTYFSRGCYAPEAQRKKTEEWKHVFSYNRTNKHVTLPNRKNGNIMAVSGFRCVRDRDQTGTVTGRMYLESSRLMPGEQTRLHFNFSSTAAAFTSGKLYLCYDDENAHVVEKEIPLATQPEGMSYQTSQVFTAPDPQALTPSAGAPPVQMGLRLVLTNVRDGSETSYFINFMVADVDISCDFDLLPGSDPTLGFPIRVHAATSSGASIKRVVLQGKRADAAAWSDLQTFDFTAGDAKGEYETTTYFKPATLTQTTYLFRLVATSYSATKNMMTTPMKSMQFVKVGFQPNVDGVTFEAAYHKWTDSDYWIAKEGGSDKTNALRWHNSLVGHVPGYAGHEQMSVICNHWYGQYIGNLDFPSGDFIEADLDLANCAFIKTTGNKKQDVGLDNIFSVGLTGANWADGSLHLYYPAHDNSTGVDQLLITAQNVSYNSTGLGPLSMSGQTRPLVLRLDRNGITYNGTTGVSNNPIYTSTVPELIAAKAVYIGAEEDSDCHLSRAIYNYVRVIRNKVGNVSEESGGGFGGDPQNGGKLN